MTKIDDSSFSLPSDPAIRKKIRDVFYEIAGAKQFIQDKNEYIKDCVAVLHEEHHIPKKLIGKIAKIVFDHNYDEITEEHSMIETIYDGVMDINGITTSSNSDED